MTITKTYTIYHSNMVSEGITDRDPSMCHVTLKLDGQLKWSAWVDLTNCESRIEIRVLVYCIIRGCMYVALANWGYVLNLEQTRFLHVGFSTNHAHMKTSSIHKHYMSRCTSSSTIVMRVSSKTSLHTKSN